MTDRVAAMNDAKRTINGEKYERVRAVIAQIGDQGRDDELKATIIARRAGVHRSFVSSHFAAEIAHAQRGDPVAVHRRPGRPDRAQRRVTTGRDGDRQTAGARSAAGDPRAQGPARTNARRGDRRRPTPSTGRHPRRSRRCSAEVEQLLATQVDLRRQLRDTEEELEAARRLNRTLMRERNTTATEATA